MQLEDTNMTNDETTKAPAAPMIVIGLRSPALCFCGKYGRSLAYRHVDGWKDGNFYKDMYCFNTDCANYQITARVDFQQILCRVVETTACEVAA